MEISVNGKMHFAQDGMTISEFLISCSIDPAKVVVEVNNSIISRELFDKQAFCSSDKVEILRFVGGG